MSLIKLNDFSIRLRLTKASVILAFIVGILMSQQLWITEGRLFPAVKPFDFIPTLSSSFDIPLLLLFTGSSITWIFYENRVVGLITVASLIILLSQDQMRWQPWVYLYLLMLCAYLSHSKNTKNEHFVIAALQLIIVGVYVWSGLHKLNQNFIEVSFTQMISKMGISLDKKLGYLVPIIEIAIGAALLFRKSLKAGIFAAIVMHLGVLFYLSPLILHHNSIVYPWNVVMIIFVCLLFSNNKNRPMHFFRRVATDFTLLLPLLLTWIFPALNLLGYWDHYLSFSLYSDKTPKYYIAIEESEVHKLGGNYGLYFAEIEGLQGGRVIDLDKWALTELNVPFYPEIRFFKKISTQFCTLGIADDKLIFLEENVVKGRSQFNKYSCSDL